MEAIKRCVAAGLGVGFLPALAVGELLARGELAALRWEKSFAVQTQVVWHRQKWLSPAERRLVELCRAAAQPE